MASLQSNSTQTKALVMEAGGWRDGSTGKGADCVIVRIRVKTQAPFETCNPSSEGSGGDGVTRACSCTDWAKKKSELQEGRWMEYVEYDRRGYLMSSSDSVCTHRCMHLCTYVQTYWYEILIVGLRVGRHHYRSYWYSKGSKPISLLSLLLLSKMLSFYVAQVGLTLSLQRAQSFLL